MMFNFVPGNSESSDPFGMKTDTLNWAKVKPEVSWGETRKDLSAMNMSDIDNKLWGRNQVNRWSQRSLSRVNPVLAPVTRATLAGEKLADKAIRYGGKIGKVAALATPIIMGSIGMYAMYSSTRSQVQSHEQMNKAFKRMKASVRNGGMTRRADFEYNPMSTFSRPRVRGGHMGASGNLTLSLNSSRTTR